MVDQNNEATVQREIIAARSVLEAHVNEVKAALDSLNQLVRGDLGINQFRALGDALDGFAPAKKAVELGRKIVKARLQAELTGTKKTADAE